MVYLIYIYLIIGLWLAKIHVINGHTWSAVGPLISFFLMVLFWPVYSFFTRDYIVRVQYAITYRHKSTNETVVLIKSGYSMNEIYYKMYRSTNKGGCGLDVSDELLEVRRLEK